MNAQELEPVALLMNDAYLATWAYSSSFHDEYDQPPTLAAKVHHMRSIIQAGLQKSDRYALGADYAEFGRVLFTDGETDTVYLLRSGSAVSIEQEKRQGALFDARRYLTSDVTMVVYRFHRDGLDLSITGTRHERKRTHLEASGAPTFVATWPYAAGDHPAFDQRAESDPFGSLGALDIDEENNRK